MKSESIAYNSTLSYESMFLRRQGEARRGDQPPSSRLGEYKARQDNAILVKNERKGGK
jgi:hypothetical protein